MEIFAFVVIVFSGMLAEDLFPYWPNAGAIFATATAGAFILWAVRHPRERDKNGKGADQDN